MSAFLVASLDSVMEAFGLSQFSEGVNIVPLIGNVAERVAAFHATMKSQMDLSLSLKLADRAAGGAVACLCFAADGQFYGAGA